MNELESNTPVFSDKPVLATFLDGHMKGRILDITRSQDRLTFNKLEKNLLEAPAELKIVDYRKVHEDHTYYYFRTVEGILNDADQ